MSIKKHILALLVLTLGMSSFSHAQTYLTETSGDIIQVALPVIAIAANLDFGEDATSFSQYSKAFAASLLLTYYGKILIDKERPNGATDGLSFPSGHTSSAFAGATLMTYKYGWKIGIPAYVLASFVGYTRIAAKRHDIYDVIGGAIIGSLSSYLFMKSSKDVEIKFSMVNNNYQLGFAMNF